MGSSIPYVKEVAPPPNKVEQFLYSWRNWLNLLWAGTVHKNTTGNCTVGYTTDIHAVGTITTPHTPDLKQEHLKTATVTADFTLDSPTDTGHCEYYLTVTGAGGYTVTPGTGVDYVGTIPSLTTGTNYVMNVRHYGTSKTVIQIVTLV